MKKLNEYYKRLLNEDETFGTEGPIGSPGGQGYTDPLPKLPNRPCYNCHPEHYLGQEYQPWVHDPTKFNTPTLPWHNLPGYYPDVHHPNPNFPGWTPWDGQGTPPKNSPHILDPHGIFPAIPLSPIRPANYPMHLPSPPPPGSPYYESFKYLFEVIKDIPDWVKTPDDLRLYLSGMTDKYGIHLYQYDNFWNALNLLLLVASFIPWTSFLSKTIKYGKLAKLMERQRRDLEQKLDMIDIRQGDIDIDIPGDHGPRYPWGYGDPPNGIAPEGWYKDATGYWQQIYPHESPWGAGPGHFVWQKTPLPSRWVFIPNGQGQPTHEYFPFTPNFSSPYGPDGPWYPMGVHDYVPGQFPPGYIPPNSFPNQIFYPITWHTPGQIPGFQ